jgi:hypothetical protein
MKDFENELEKAKTMAGTTNKKTFVIRTLTCPHCKFTGAANMMFRHHFDNCPNVTGKKLTQEAIYYRMRKETTEKCLKFFKETDINSPDFAQKFEEMKQFAANFKWPVKTPQKGV